jgi:asparagine synthase (glutamine-hydrolysing)
MVRLSPALPPHLKLAAGVEKVVMKRAFAGLVPDVVIARPKSGMRVPVHHWFQGEMRRYARHLLDPKRLKRHGIWDPERVKQLLAYDTEEANGRYGIRLWMLLTFETWRAIVIDGEAP